MKEYIKPEVEVYDFTTEAIASMSGDATDDSSIWDD